VDSPVDLPIKDHFELGAVPVRRLIDMPGWAEEKERPRPRSAANRAVTI
jgi:hypothetical protein